MSLSVGDKLGPYEIIAPIGKGGMGEVYKARDARLDRIVAIKTSNLKFSERFEREARAVAALNHPNICTLHDIGPNYLVMEFVEGVPLKGPLPLDKALACARQITSALEAAHERHITHRDLKPGNILVTSDGIVKVLDFGLAKIGEPPRTDSDPENSPTLTMSATAPGTILGTAAYMSPEQARGKNVDKRADIWAFGVILFEILTGKRLFKGEDVAETLAAVVMNEPDLGQVPPEVRRLLKKCLQKDPKKRLRDIGDAWELLDNVELATATAARKSPKLALAAIGLATLALIGGAAWIQTRLAPLALAPVVRFSIPPPADALFTARGSGSEQQALSPDGRYLVFVADSAKDDQRQFLWVRPIDSEKAQQLAGTEGASLPFWSPDSRNIAFFAANKLKRVPITGGGSLNLADSPGRAQGGAWFQDGSPEGMILFSPEKSAILRVPAAGGVPLPATELAPGETGHLGPQMLPDGKRFLYLAGALSAGAEPAIYLQQLGSQERTRLLGVATRAVFAPPDMLLYLRDNSLLAQHWDWISLQPLGEPVQIADRVAKGGVTGHNTFSVSATGALVYRESGPEGTARYQWFSRNGQAQEFATSRKDFANIELSPDRRQAVVRTPRDLYLLELSSGVVSAMTNDEAVERAPVWSPDGRRIAFRKPDGIYQMVVGNGKTDKVSPEQLLPEAWLPDGLLSRDRNRLVLLPMPGEDAARPSEHAARELAQIDVLDQVRVAPGGKTVAYRTGAADNTEVWVADFPSMENRRKVVSGMAPLWRPDGHELFFINGNTVKSVDVIPGATLAFGQPRTLVSSPQLAVASTGIYLYAVSADGKRVLVRINDDRTNEIQSLHVVLNWPSLVK